MIVCRVEGGLLIGHVAAGNGVAGLLQERGPRSWTGMALGAGEVLHGGNDAGVVCAALDGSGGHPLVRAVLAQAGSAEQAVAILRERVEAEGATPVALMVADAVRAHRVELAGSELRVSEVSYGAGAGFAVADLIATLRRAEPAPEVGRAPVAGLAALLSATEPPRLHFALGPPSCSVFIRHWPGMELTPEESASPDGSPLARLAAAVAEATATDPERRAAARARLDLAEADALQEGEVAERMAARMDGDTDDRGATVRRFVAQVYAVELARRALEELAVPAPTGSGSRPRL